MAIEVQVERMRVSEMMSARDAAVQRLSNAYESLRQKTAIIERLKQEKQEPTCNSPFPSNMNLGLEQLEIARLREEIASLEVIIKDLRHEIRTLKDSTPGYIKSSDPPPQYDEAYLKVSFYICITLHLICPGSSRTLESRTPLPSF
jgi:DNA repair exonuclease SbcCD ATPase subunit